MRNPSGENLRSNFAGSLLLHAAVAAVLVGWSAFSHRGHSWGQHDVSAGAIQATVVSALPLPPRQRDLDTGVLTSETPSPAPVTAREKTEPPPSPKDIAIQAKNAKVKPAPKTVTEAPRHPQPVPVQPTKATTGETAGIRIAQATMQLRNGTASVTVDDRNFGDRFAYYVNIVNRKVAQNWYTQEADPRASAGKRVTVIFDIGRDGMPSNIRIGTRSGSPSLDTSAVRAVQRVQDEGFGPLPQGNNITVEYSFDYRTP
ncbi:MAG: energy transducer TonB [Acidobacteriota bacterium]|nr:energy transducer TonB [Acidobacteriota bacterium]